MTLEIGEPAPDFTLAGDDGEISLAALKGRKVVVYFYPRDDTPGCTTESIAFSALADEFAAAGALVIGVSKDSIAAHAKFRAKHGLTVRLASDPDNKVIDAYGAWREKSMYGKKYMGIERSTVLIDSEGRVARLWPKVKIAGHAEEVLAAAKAL